jgi:hypothetical protein
MPRYLVDEHDRATTRFKIIDVASPGDMLSLYIKGSYILVLMGKLSDGV